VDDFVIFCKSREDAERVKKILATEGTEVTEEVKRFRGLGDIRCLVTKSFCINDYGVFVGMEGGDIVIKKGKNIIELMPFSKVSEIEIKGDSIVSAGLLRRCIERGIPLGIRLIGGYLVAGSYKG
jgi:hypothetical protein